MKNFSIIIPNKNNVKLLQRLLDSIPYRTDTEIIIVDDDSNPVIISPESYPGHERNDVKIIFSKEGKGAGAARNIGLKYCTGKWILFADSDDFYNKGAFDVLYSYRDSKADIVFFDVNSVDTVTLEKSNRDKNYGKYIDLFLTGKEPDGFSIKYKKWEPWFKMFRREFIISNKIQFDEIPRCNDMSFNLKASYLADNIDATREKLYCITTNPASITKKKIDKEVFWNCILCEVRKNYLYSLLNHKNWQTRYVFITACLIMNNGIMETLEFIKMLYDRRNLIRKFREEQKYYFVKNDRNSFIHI